jgi:hypothetical protein
MDWSECALSLWKMHSRCSQILQRVITPQQTTLTESASMELNQALLALRLWLLLIQQICGKSALSTVVGHVADRDQCERVLWNELWPSFERLLLFSISVAGYDEYQVRNPPKIKIKINYAHCADGEPRTRRMLPWCGNLLRTSLSFFIIRGALYPWSLLWSCTLFS